MPAAAAWSMIARLEDACVSPSRSPTITSSGASGRDSTRRAIRGHERLEILVGADSAGVEVEPLVREAQALELGMRLLAASRTKAGVGSLGYDGEPARLECECLRDCLAGGVRDGEERRRSSKREPLFHAPQRARLPVRVGELRELNADRVVDAHDGRCPKHREIGVDRREDECVEVVAGRCPGQAQEIGCTATRRGRHRRLLTSAGVGRGALRHLSASRSPRP